ncbi:taste receptor type 2 member 1 [Orycteropus afer afer]|uniref:Taste receptor type 2 n=1 Tax=Orycteropus afer afer TaxID=1230840 RepID=A0A8B7B4G3_ORYAF|nr:taste receptor type 2 member 1 [Orycteropus afer afer]
MDLIKTRTWTSLGLLLSCLSVSRVCLQLMLFYVTLIFLSLAELPSLSEYFAIAMFVNESGLWFATWLGVFYCVRIANVAHQLFFWLKRRISRLIPWLILASLFYSSIISVIYSKYMWLVPEKILLQYFSKNATTHSEAVSAVQYVLVFALSLPFLIFLAAVLLLVFSLARHTRQMRRMVASTGDAGRSAPLSALLSILSFLILYLSHCMVGALFSSQIFQMENLVLLCTSLGGMYPAAHSVILILGNSKLKQNARLLLLHGRCRP